MRKPMPLDQAAYQTGLACSLFEVIMDKACDECSKQLIDLISIACDINAATHSSLKAALED